MSHGVDLIAAERARQMLPKRAGGEGWTAAHDRGHADELAQAGAVYALPRGVRIAALWPWAYHWWKPTPQDRIRELTKAGALIAAAIDDLRPHR